MSAALPVLLSRPVALAGGIDPEDASPGMGAFITFLILALVIVLLAWSFTRHQRRIQANAAAREEQLRQEAEAEQADLGGSSVDSADRSTAAGQEPNDAPAPASPELPDRSTDDDDGTPR